MFPGMNQRKMQQVMKRMGIAQQDIDATQVIIKTPAKEIIINNPQVAKVNMMGQETYQVVGKPEEHSLSSEPEINDDDIKTVMQQAKCSKEEAVSAIADAGGDLAKAILSLQKGNKI